MEDGFGAFSVPVGEELRSRAATVLADWEARCARDDAVRPGETIPSADYVLSSLGDALERPQPIDAGPDEVVSRLAGLFANLEYPVTVAARQMLYLEQAILEPLHAILVVPDERLAASRRAHTLVTWLVTHIAAARLTALALDALTNPLTGLPSKSLFHRDIQTEASRFGGGAQLIRVVAVDLDKFKRINDTLGHAAGDLVLQRFAAELSSAVGPSGTAYHLSGDEFALIVREGDLDAITRRAGAAAAVGCTFGATHLLAEDSVLPPQVVHDRADQELLRMKEAKKSTFERLMKRLCPDRR